MSSPRWTYLVWIELVSTSAILVPAGIDTVVLSAVAWELPGESASGVVREGCCAPPDIARNREMIKAKPCLVLVLARFRVVGRFEKIRNRRSFGAIVLPPV